MVAPEVSIPVGGHSEVAQLDTVLIKDVRAAFRDQDHIDRQWQALHYADRPEWEATVAESDAFGELLESLGVGLVRLPVDDAVGLDSVYARDASIVCDRGLILGSMGKPERRGEPEAVAVAARSLGIPICGRIEGDGTLEGGDVVWLDDRTVAVGQGYRTNAEGIRQLTDLLGSLVDEVVVAHLPHEQGPQDVFHLMSALSPVDDGVALVYSPLLSVPFREALLERGWRLLEVPDEEYATLGGNVLAVGPGRCVMVAGNPQTRWRLEAAGIEVHEFVGRELCLKGAGGPTCLTRPLRRGGATHRRS